MGNAGSGLTFVEGRFLELLSEHPNMGSVVIEGKRPTKATDLETPDGFVASLAIMSASGDLTVAGAGNAGRVSYDEVGAIIVVAQVIAQRTLETGQEVKERAELLLNAVIETCMTHPNYRDDEDADTRHNRLELFVDGWDRVHGDLPNGKGFGVRYTIRLSLYARIQPSAVP